MERHRSARARAAAYEIPHPVPGAVRRIRFAFVALAVVMLLGSIGYLILGFSPLDAIYQTVMTVTTVGFRELRPLTAAGKIYTIFVILVGVGTSLYALGVVLEALVEGHLRELMRRRRMERDIQRMHGHVIVCGWGRVGRAVAAYVANAGEDVVVIDRDTDRLATVAHAKVLGDVTDDGTLLAAGIERAGALVAALETDADNLFVTVSARAFRPDLMIIARARTEASEPKLRRAGANRVINPQQVGGDRMAACAVQPHVVDFLDVVMHDADLEIRLEEAVVQERSPLAGRTIGDARIYDKTGALVVAVRDGDGRFTTNPGPDTRLTRGDVLIAIGASAQLAALLELAGGRRR